MSKMERALQAGANFNIGGNGTIGGNLVVGGSITGTFSVPATNITGILAPLNGGTGVNAAGSAGTCSEATERSGRARR